MESDEEIYITQNKFSERNVGREFDLSDIFREVIDEKNSCKLETTNCLLTEGKDVHTYINN